MRLEFPQAWQTATARLLAQHVRAKVLVLGETDRGKSSFCRLLTREIVSQGADVSYLDADIGQKDIGPPATITLGLVGKDADVRGAELIGMYFVGALSPIGHFLPVIVGTRRLADSVLTPFTVINTPGFVRASGRILTAYQIESLCPDVIVAIETGRELEPILREYRHFKILRLKPAPAARSKSQAVRAEIRRLALQDYFQVAREIRLPADKLIFQRRDGYDVTERLCGLADLHGNCLGVGMLQAASQKSVSLFTPVSKEKVKIVQIGSLRMTLDMSLVAQN